MADQTIPEIFSENPISVLANDDLFLVTQSGIFFESGAITYSGLVSNLSEVIGSSLGSDSFVSNEVAGGTVNGSNTVFTTANAYVPGTLAVYRDGQLMTRTGDYTETTSTSFTFVTAPLTGSVIVVFYQTSVNVSGNADTLDGQHATSFMTYSGVHFMYPFASYINISPLTATNSYPFSSTLPSFTTHPKQYSQAVFIAAGTNNTSNYWTLELRDAGTGTVIASVTTYGLTANAGYTLTDTTMGLSSLDQSTHKYLYLIAIKTGTPANLNVHAPAVEYTLE